MKGTPSIFFAHSASLQDGPGEGSYSLVELLKRKLSGEHYILFPVIEDPGAPTYAQWERLFAKEFKSLDRPMIFIGHSLGGSMLLKFISEERPDIVVSALFLIATPQWGKDGWDIEEFRLKADPKIPAAAPVFLNHSKDDDVVPVVHLEFYKDLFPHATVRVLNGDDHAFENGLPQLIKDIRSLGSKDQNGH